MVLIPDGGRLGKVEVFSKTDKLFYYILVIIGLLLTIVFAVWWFGAGHLPQNFSGGFHALDFILFILLSFVVWYQIINEILFWSISSRMKTPIPVTLKKIGRVAFLTAFVPDKEPLNLLEKSLTAMKDVDYTHDTWVLDEGDDESVKQICKKMGIFHFSRKGIAKYNQPSGKFRAKTKAGNFNAWFEENAKYYDFVAQLDVDFVPKKNFLTSTLGYFRNPEIAFVGTPQIYGNTKESWIAKGSAQQAYSFYGPVQKGLFGADMSFFIGANHVVRVSAHDFIEGYSGHIVEDHLTGMRFYASSWKSIYHPEILAVGLGPSTWQAYFSQQMRWAYGLIDILIHHSPKLFTKMHFKHSLYYFLFQQTYFSGLAQGFGVLLLALYFIFGINSTSMSFLELLLFYPGIILIQIVIFLYLQRYYIDLKNESGIHLEGRLLSLATWPIYLLAFFSVIINRRLTYKVTPKETQDPSQTNIVIFLPHFILGTITAVGLIVGIFLNHTAKQLVFFAVLNTTIMYGVIVSVLMEKLIFSLRKKIYSIPKIQILSN